MNRNPPSPSAPYRGCDMCFLPHLGLYVCEESKETRRSQTRLHVACALGTPPVIRLTCLTPNQATFQDSRCAEHECGAAALCRPSLPLFESSLPAPGYAVLRNPNRIEMQSLTMDDFCIRRNLAAKSSIRLITRRRFGPWSCSKEMQVSARPRPRMHGARRTKAKRA